MDYFTLAMQLGVELLEKFPSYDQRKKQQFFDKKNLYNQEKAKTYEQRDDDLLLSLKEELGVFLESFLQEIKGSKA